MSHCINCIPKFTFYDYNYLHIQAYVPYRVEFFCIFKRNSVYTPVKMAGAQSLIVRDNIGIIC